MVSCPGRHYEAGTEKGFCGSKIKLCDGSRYIIVDDAKRICNVWDNGKCRPGDVCGESEPEHPDSGSDLDQPDSGSGSDSDSESSDLKKRGDKTDTDVEDTEDFNITMIVISVVIILLIVGALAFTLKKKKKGGGGGFKIDSYMIPIIVIFVVWFLISLIF